MLAVEVLGGVVVLLALAFVLSRGFSGLDDEPEDSVDSGIPADRLLRSDDIERVRFRVGVRGYRMADVDAAMDALQRSLAAHEQPVDASGGEPEEPMLADQPPMTVDRPLSELEQTYAAPDESP
jgi:DivIVA domain-containing protein